MLRRSLPFLLAAAVAVIVVVGLLQAGGGGDAEEKFTLPTALQQLRGAPEPLAGLHAQANQLLDAGFDERMKELEGTPVVVNKWASWCGPCRAEFPVFQRVSTKLGREVAFLGLNSADNRQDAARFLKGHPVPFPSYVDPRHVIAERNGGGRSFPTTVFFDRDGKRAFVHQGQYRNDADLLADIEKYAR